MKEIYLFSFIVLVFSSCITRIAYLGSTDVPTSQVDIFVNENAIKKNYEIVGKGYIHYGVYSRGIENIQKKAIAKAKQVGANGILFQDYYIPNTGTSINTVMRSDSVAKGLITIGNSTVQSTGTGGFNILFLKYTN